MGMGSIPREGTRREMGEGGRRGGVTSKKEILGGDLRSP
jgi:hypothetical protein